ncbi:MAG: hypothetical protein A2138_17035 [Deltaproteobacteria bacterium RBG_16_71_12]|nr:MAG: hypothetical protein A2138_17035 [Deltaproteobacteria bacterium RBG_16_71_12]
MDAPTFTDGMFSDVVLDEATWNAEVARRAAPHQAALAREAERQGRFQAWKRGLLLEQQALTCTVDESGRCALRALWPSARLAVTFGGLACAAPPPEPPPTAAPAPEETVAPPAGAPPAAGPIVAWLPTLPEPKAPIPLAVPPRPDDDVRGEGALATLDAWSAAGDSVLYDGDAQPLWRRAERARGARGQPLRDATLVCRIDARGDFDIDGSAPELRARLALGYDAEVAGQSFAMTASRRRMLGLRHVTLLPGELVKLSLIDVDALVDDWVGMDVVTFDGRLPLRFEGSRFSARCGVVDPAFER